MYYLNNGVHDQAKLNMQAIDEYYVRWNNVVTQNYNKCSKLTLRQKLVEASKSQSKHASHVSVCPT